MIESILPTAISPKLLNAAAVLTFAWDRDDFTASDAIAATGLTRTTVIGLCVELVERGWLTELPDSRTAGKHYQKGRPARRYAFHARRAVIVGVDAGMHTVTTRVADLRGHVLAHSSAPLAGDWPTGDERVVAIDDGITHGLALAGVDAAEVLCVVVGVPAPADAQGTSPEGAAGFWRRMNPDLVTHLHERGWTAIIENDANLAAIGEGGVGAGVGLDCYITLLSGERFGAGFVLNGRLVRGSRGGAGEMHPLSQVEGVGEAQGIGAIARDWAREAKEGHHIPAGSSLSGFTIEELNAAAVLHAADEGDPTALRIVDRAATRLARISALLGGLLDVDRIIVAGGVAESLTLLLSRAEAQLTGLMDLPPPELVASTLGSDVVSIGAVSRGLAWAKENVQTLIADSAPREQ